VIAALFLILSILGKGTTVESAFLILIDMSLLIYFVPYLYLFVCFVVHSWRQDHTARLVTPGGRIGALLAGASGFGVTLFAMALATIPPPGTSDMLVHEIKLGGGSVLLLGTGFLIHWRVKVKQRK
jgi:amino acid transporter